MLGSAPPPAPVPESLLAQLAQIPDPRVERTKQHQLTDILAIAILAELCAADSFTEMAQFGRAREPWLRSFLALPGGIPSHDTFTRAFARLNPDAFAARLAEWAQALAALAQEEHRQAERIEAERVEAKRGAEVVAIDGKTARRSYDARSAQVPLHTVSAWATAHHLVLGPVKTAAHSNEITAIPELLALLDLRGTTVTIDAMGSQKSITTAIRSDPRPGRSLAHYVLALKSNQPWQPALAPPARLCLPCRRHR